MFSFSLIPTPPLCSFHQLFLNFVLSLIFSRNNLALLGLVFIKKKKKKKLSNMSYLTTLFFPIKVRKVVFFSGLPILVFSSEIACQHGDGFVFWISLSQFCSKLGYNHHVVLRLPCRYLFRKVSSENQQCFFLWSANKSFCWVLPVLGEFT